MHLLLLNLIHYHSPGDRDEVVLISPEVTQFIKLCAEEEGEDATLAIFLEPLRLQQKKLAMMAINDQSGCDTPGGSHWSLLIYSR